jgi:hypothetical protein
MWGEIDRDRANQLELDLNYGVNKPLDEVNYVKSYRQTHDPRFENKQPDLFDGTEWAPRRHAERVTRSRNNGPAFLGGIFLAAFWFTSIGFPVDALAETAKTYIGQPFFIDHLKIVFLYLFAPISAIFLFFVFFRLFALGLFRTFPFLVKSAMKIAVIGLTLFFISFVIVWISFK